jgi:hypothetical protein
LPISTPAGHQHNGFWFSETQWADPTSQRDVPPGLTKRDEKALRKIRKRAHYLDKGMNLCGFRVGWTFWIGTCSFPVPKASTNH